MRLPGHWPRRRLPFRPSRAPVNCIRPSFLLVFAFAALAIPRAPAAAPEPDAVGEADAVDAVDTADDSPAADPALSPIPALDDDAPAEGTSEGTDTATLPASFGEWLERSPDVCVGRADARLAEPQHYEHGGFRYVIEGASASVERSEPSAARTRLGVLNCIKDFSPETRANLAEYLARFEASQVDGIVVAGDTAYTREELEHILDFVAAPGVPVYALIGNMESRAAFNAAVSAVHARHPNVLHLGLVRRIETSGATLVSMPGYHDARFSHQIDGCLYTPEDVDSVGVLAKEASSKVLLVSHGPPRQSGRHALDYVPEHGNVGDRRLAKVLKESEIPFGIFGHVQEAGGHATDRHGRGEIRPLTSSPELYVNPGPANSLPWRMNAGPESHGMAVILSIENDEARYEVLRSPRRVAIADD